MKKTSRRREWEWDIQWGDLARYNTERARGLVHTAEKSAAMAEKQARYNEWMREQYPDAIWIEKGDVPRDVRAVGVDMGPTPEDLAERERRYEELRQDILARTPEDQLVPVPSRLPRLAHAWKRLVSLRHS